MWRVWKKRKARLREQAKASKIEAGEKILRVRIFTFPIHKKCAEIKEKSVYRLIIYSRHSPSLVGENGKN